MVTQTANSADHDRTDTDLDERDPFLSTPSRGLSRQGSQDLEKGGLGDAKQKTLGLANLVIITYFCVSGGPYGTEGLVSSAPPLFVFGGLIVFPLIWSLPLSLICAELSAITHNHDGGLISWVTHAFGRFPGFLVGFLNAITSLLDNSLYPIISTSYILQMLQNQAPGFYSGYVEGNLTAVSWLIGFMIILFVCLVNILGLEVVGATSWALTIIIFSPFVALLVMGLVKAHHHDVSSDGTPIRFDLRAPFETNGTIQWEDYISFLIWANIGWLQAGFLAGEVKNPNRTFPIGMMLSAIAVSSLYIFPIALSLMLYPDWSQWVDGSFGTVGGLVGGPILSGFFVIASAVCNIGVYIAGLSTAARGLAYMAMPDQKLLPKFLSYSTAGAFSKPEDIAQSEGGTNPLVAIVVSSTLASLLLLLPLDSIVDVEILLNSVVTIMVFLSFIYLRFKQPNAERSYRVPVNNFIAVLLCIPGVAVSVFLMTHTSAYIAEGSASALALTLVVYALNNRYQMRSLWYRYVLRSSSSHSLLINQDPREVPQHSLREGYDADAYQVRKEMSPLWDKSVY